MKMRTVHPMVTTTNQTSWRIFLDVRDAGPWISRRLRWRLPSRPTNPMTPSRTSPPSMNVLSRITLGLKPTHLKGRQRWTRLLSLRRNEWHNNSDPGFSPSLSAGDTLGSFGGTGAVLSSPLALTTSRVDIWRRFSLTTGAWILVLEAQTPASRSWKTMTPRWRQQNERSDSSATATPIPASTSSAWTPTARSSDSPQSHQHLLSLGRLVNRSSFGTQWPRRNGF